MPRQQKSLSKILSNILAKVPCLGVGTSTLAKSRAAGTESIKSPSGSVGTMGSADLPNLPPWVQDPGVLCRLVYIQPLTECALYTLEDSTPASQAA